MAYDAKIIANYFLGKAESEGRTLTPMQVQKLVYFAHGWYLALFGEPLISEPVQAWSYGPVIPSLYQEFKRFGNEGIEGQATIVRFAGTRFSIGRPSIEGIENPEERERMTSFLDRLWQVYSRFSAIQLSNMTHSEDSPWKIALQNSNGARATVINDNLIRTYFQNQRTTNQQAHARTAER